MFSHREKQAFNVFTWCLNPCWIIDKIEPYTGWNFQAICWKVRPVQNYLLQSTLFKYTLFSKLFPKTWSPLGPGQNAECKHNKSNHYLNQCQPIDSWTNRNKLRWNGNQNRNIFNHESVLENSPWKCGHFARPQCVKHLLTEKIYATS